MKNLNWRIDPNDIDETQELNFGSMASLKSIQTQEADVVDYDVVFPYKAVFLNNRPVCLYPLTTEIPDGKNPTVLKEIKAMRDIKNEFLSPFIGCVVDSDRLNGIVIEFGGKGTLVEMFFRSKIRFDEM